MISLWLYLRREFLTSLKSAAQIFFLDDEISQLSCDVAIVGGGISGLYVAETLLRFHKETNVCLFERNNRFGGRIHDYTFQGIRGIPVSKCFCK